MRSRLSTKSLDVAAGAERLAGAGDDDAANAGSSSTSRAAWNSSRPSAEVERVERVGAVEGDRRDAVAALQGQVAGSPWRSSSAQLSVAGL